MYGNFGGFYSVSLTLGSYFLPLKEEFSD